MMDLSTLFFFLLLSMILGVLMLMGNLTLKSLLVSSSIYSTVWFFMFFSVSPLQFLLFFFLYFIFLSLLLSVSQDYNLVTLQISLLTCTTMFFLMGLPPFSLFFYKFYVLNFLWSSYSWLFLTCIWLASFLALVGYFSYLFYSLFFYDCPQKYTISPSLLLNSCVFLILSYLFFFYLS